MPSPVPPTPLRAGDALVSQLGTAGVERVFAADLAADHCVFNTVPDALQHRYQTVLLLDAIRAVDVGAGAGDGEQAIAELLQGGAIGATLPQIRA